MRVLVLGAHGFIGRHVCRLLAEHATVVRADIDPEPSPDFLQVDPDAPQFLWLVERAAPDVMINCAGAASVPSSFEAPFRDYTLNTYRVVQMLESIRVSRRSVRFINLSSAAVYGNPATMPVPETAPPAPVSPYGWHKRQSELVCQEYAGIHGIETLSMRIFSAYGPGLRKQLFWDLYQKAQRKPQVEMHGTGEETRDFIYVDDLVACIRVLIERGDFDGRAVNVASGVQVSIRTAAETLIRHLGLERELVFNGVGRRGDPERWQADIGYLRGLGFAPAFDINDGLAETARWLSAQA